jgi:hypothetical protein
MTVEMLSNLICINGEIVSQTDTADRHRCASPHKLRQQAQGARRTGMAELRIETQLAAILAADVAGYSRPTPT